MLPTREITFSINGAPRRANVPLDMSALTLIRDVLGLTGTKYGCGEGECGRGGWYGVDGGVMRCGGYGCGDGECGVGA